MSIHQTEKMTFNGYRVITDDNLPVVPVYPTGKKDGNKLAKRKRSLTTSHMYIVGDTVICNTTAYEQLQRCSDAGLTRNT